MRNGAGGAALAMIVVDAEPEEAEGGRADADTGAQERAEPKASPRILLVEDDFLVGMEIESGLADAGLEVVGVAASAAEALAIAERERPALVVMDIRLAGDRDGIDAAIEIQRRLGIRSLFASAHGDAQVRARGEAARPLGWIGKPYRVSALVAAVRDALGRLEEEPRSEEPRMEG
jgi:DNA-binding NarL/FixJ family response regulator